MDVATAMANSRKAEQDALTVAKQGEAAAAKAKWAQEAVKAQAVTQAQQEKEVAVTEPSDASKSPSSTPTLLTSTASPSFAKPRATPPTKSR